jgi:hypothetical protein
MRPLVRGLPPVILCVVFGCDDARFGEFVGTWRFEPGSTGLTACSDGSSATDPLTGGPRLEEGSDSDLIRVTEDCSILFDVEGDTASALAGQTCEGTTDSGVNFMGVFDSDVYTLEGDGMMREDATVSVTFADLPVTCTLTIAATLRR